MDNSQLSINQIIEAATNNEKISLSAPDVKILATEIGSTRFVSVYSNEQIIKLVEEGKHNDRNT
ncbi:MULTISPECIES: hypothetical protein [unclassified Acinetobacter]|uniref:hypothetical protein n=1 Tax=unclassified Acinetobacter TaxID=196816 RepID=UPI0007D092C7|nr:hypothetical protein [Acinetobacter sp. SFA]OAL80670.1 hypothetical protein AY607_02970 [Acinetobacter sp. SFA]